MARMTRRKRKQMERRRRFQRFLLVFIVIIVTASIKTSFNYCQKKADKLAKSGDVEEAILLMSEKAPINIAFKEKKEALAIEKARIEAEEEKARIAEEKRQEELAEKKRQEKLAEEKRKAKAAEERRQVEAKKINGKNVAYLTFDDGPSSSVTPQILDVLKKYNIKGTFFVLGTEAENNPEILKRIHREGHAIGNHSYSHNYSYLYSSTDNFMNDIHKAEQVLKNILGENFSTNLLRFPGGSHGKVAFQERAASEGYNSYDWNALNGDSEGLNFSKDRLVNRLKETSQGKGNLIVLMHDTNAKQNTVYSLPEIIEYLQGKGYEFDVLK